MSKSRALKKPIVRYCILFEKSMNCIVNHPLLTVLFVFLLIALSITDESLGISKKIYTLYPLLDIIGWCIPILLMLGFLLGLYSKAYCEKRSINIKYYIKSK